MRKTTAEINEALWGSILHPVLNDLTEDGELENMVDKLMRRETDPYSLAEEVAQRYMKAE